MVAVAILRKPPSIWFINFPGKVLLLALNVRQGAMVSFAHSHFSWFQVSFVSMSL